eukprot:TRINITY_DN18481_c0_g1_i1.p1 TRINITY_DN18481_c0_g1~~TRINITY_DN18481_c0_g1_i1.p1  ORF type:complete len:534 (-),score=108.77 TRINITY_DN18481_c0_g1_i1:206-1807(-)
MSDPLQLPKKYPMGRFNPKDPKFKSSYHPDTPPIVIEDSELESKLKKRQILAGSSFANESTHAFKDPLLSPEISKMNRKGTYDLNSLPRDSPPRLPPRPTSARRPALPTPLANDNENNNVYTSTSNLSKESQELPRSSSDSNSITSKDKSETGTETSEFVENFPDQQDKSAQPVQLPEDKLDRLRFKTIQELIDSERDYIRDIDVIMRNIYNPLLENNILTKDDMRNVFSNLAQLQMINQKLLEALDTALKKANNDYNQIQIGLILKEMVDYFKSYMTYVSNSDMSLAIIERSKKKNPKFNQFVKDLSENKELRGLDMISFLIKPMQRICKYPLFLRELLKHTREDNPDLPNLESAAKGLERVAGLVNESKLKNENQAKIREIAQSLTGIAQEKIIQPSRLFVREATFVKLSPKGKEQERHFFLFNDLILWAKMVDKGRYHYRGEISIDLLLSSDIIKPEYTNENKYAFEICRLDKKKKKYVIYTTKKAEKEEWLELLSKYHDIYQENSKKRPGTTSQDDPKTRVGIISNSSR